MSLSVKIILITCVAALVGLILALPTIKLCKKMKAEQTILHYVEKHSSKAGTPTMGGIIFILAAIIACAFFCGVAVFMAGLQFWLWWLLGCLVFWTTSSKFTSTKTRD